MALTKFIYNFCLCTKWH